MKKILLAFIFAVLVAGCDYNRLANGIPIVTVIFNSAPSSTDRPTQIPDEDRKIIISGSPSIEKVVHATLEEFTGQNSRLDFIYKPKGSSTCVLDAHKATAQMGAVSRELKPDEVELGLEKTLIGYDAIAVVVNNENRVDNISTEQLKEIYTGEIIN